MYTVAEFLLAYPEPKWAAIAVTDIERAINFVSCLYDDFCCYESKYHSCLWELAVAHQLDVSGALCSDVSPWFSPGVTEVKSYNDTIKFGDSGADGLGRTYYGQQLALLLQRAKQPMLYFSGIGCW